MTLTHTAGWGWGVVDRATDLGLLLSFHPDENIDRGAVMVEPCCVSAILQVAMQRRKKRTPRVDVPALMS